MYSINVKCFVECELIRKSKFLMQFDSRNIISPYSQTNPGYIKRSLNIRWLLSESLLF
jgi:hypothetical protein